MQAPVADGGFGNRLGTHRGRLVPGSATIFGTILIVLSLVGVAANVIDDDDASNPVMIIARVALFVALGGAGGALWWLAVRRMKQSLDVYERGIVWRIGGKEHAIPLSNLASVRGVHLLKNGMKNGFVLHIKTTDGKKLTFADELRDAETLYVHLSYWPRFNAAVPGSGVNLPDGHVPMHAPLWKYRLLPNEQVVTQPHPYFGEMYRGPLLEGTGDGKSNDGLDWKGWGQNIRIVFTSFNRLILAKELGYGPFLSLRPDERRPTLLMAAEAFPGHPQLAAAQAPERYNSKVQLERLQLAQLVLPNGEKYTFWCEAAGLAHIHAWCTGQA